MTITVLTPFYNNENTLTAAFQAIVNLRHPGELEILAIDDGSTDGSAAIARNFALRYPFITLLQKRNGGQATALNLGLERAHGEFIAILEGDVEPSPDWLELVLKEFDDPRVAGAGGYLETPLEDPWPARLAGYEIELKMAGQPHHVAHITSANTVFRREVFERCGRYREDLLNASFDAEFNARVRASGGLLAFCQRARARHHYKGTVIGFWRRAFTYSRYRVHLPQGELYPYDRFLKVNVTVCALAAMLLCAFWLNPLLPIVGGALAIGMQLPHTIRLWRWKRDAALLAYPVVLIVRNWVAALGYAMGLFESAFRMRGVEDRR